MIKEFKVVFQTDYDFQKIFRHTERSGVKNIIYFKEFSFKPTEDDILLLSNGKRAGILHVICKKEKIEKLRDILLNSEFYIKDVFTKDMNDVYLYMTICYEKK